MKFELLTKQVLQDVENEKAKTANFIKSEDNDNGGLRYHSTATRWEQYTNGKITRAQAVEYATKRAFKSIDKKAAEKLQHLEAVENAPNFEYCAIYVDWVRSSTWGLNPHANVSSNVGGTYGSASGCGYDKESAAIGGALNDNLSVLKMLYEYKEQLLKEGATGKTNQDLIGYGSGYDTLPYFEGGVGCNCFWRIFEKLGYEVHESHSSKYADIYTIAKKA